MCTFENDHRVLVCDVAIARVREAASRAYGDAVRLTPIPGQGTLVEVPPTENAEAFQALARAVIAEAQRQETPLAAEEPQVQQKGGR